MAMATSNIPRGTCACNTRSLSRSFTRFEFWFVPYHRSTDRVMTPLPENLSDLFAAKNEKLPPDATRETELEFKDRTARTLRLMRTCREILQRDYMRFQRENMPKLAAGSKTYCETTQAYMYGIAHPLPAQTHPNTVLLRTWAQVRT